MSGMGSSIDPAHLVVGRAGRSYVPVLVPLDFVDEVTALVARLDERAAAERAGRPPAGPADPVGRGSMATEVGNPNGVWTEHQLRTLAAAGTPSAQRVVRMLATLGRYGPDILLSTRVLAEAAGIEERYLRSALSKLTLFVTTRPDVYGERPCWPFGWKFGALVDADNPREFHYYLTREQYAAWSAALG